MKNKSVAAAAKSLINYFRDVCPELLPNRKTQGRFTKIDESNKIENLTFGMERQATGVEGIELLEEYERRKGRLTDGRLDVDRVLTDEDLKKIRILRLREGVKRVDRHGFSLGGQPEGEEIDMEKIAQTNMNDEERQGYLAKIKELEMLRELKRKLDAGELSDQFMSEEGEAEMEDGFMADEEGEEDMEEGEDDYVEDVSDEDCPQVVPATEEGINHEVRSEVSDIDVDELSESSEYDSDELARDTTVNPHGFVYSNMLETYQKSRRDRIADMKQEKEDTRDEHRAWFKHKANREGKIGKSERNHQKNKPFMMVK